MDFYKEGKVFDIPGNATVDMSGATFNHKAVIINSKDGAALQACSIKFGSVGGKSPSVALTINGPFSGVGDMSNGNLANSIIPGRVVEIAGAASTGTITVVLLN